MIVDLSINQSPVVNVIVPTADKYTSKFNQIFTHPTFSQLQ